MQTHLTNRKIQTSNIALLFGDYMRKVLKVADEC